MLERQVLIMQLGELQPHSCSSLGEQYEVVRSVASMRQNLAAMRHQLSDASLQQVRLDVSETGGVLSNLGHSSDARVYAAPLTQIIQSLGATDSLFCNHYKLVRAMLSG